MLTENRYSVLRPTCASKTGQSFRAPSLPGTDASIDTLRPFSSSSGSREHINWST